MKKEDLRFKVGDRVLIRKDLKGNQWYNNGETLTNVIMESYSGKYANIIEIAQYDKSKEVFDYKLDIDNGEYYWSDDMLKEVIEVAKEDIDEINNNVETEEDEKVTSFDNKLCNFIKDKYNIDLEKEKEEMQLIMLGEEIDKKYLEFCKDNSCSGGCKYNPISKKIECRTLFILDYLKENNIKL